MLRDDDEGPRRGGRLRECKAPVRCLLAAVEDKVFEGLGGSADEAEKLAINAAAKAASQIVVGQLQAKQLF